MIRETLVVSLPFSRESENETVLVPLCLNTFQGSSSVPSGAFGGFRFTLVRSIGGNRFGMVGGPRIGRQGSDIVRLADSTPINCVWPIALAR